jgi:3'-5' exoribonuclease
VNAPTDGGQDLPDPRSFCGRVPWTLSSELQDGDEVLACFVVRECRKLLTRSNQVYLRLVLGDRSGTIDGVIWDDAEAWEGVCTPSSIVGIRGRVSFYQEKLQLRVTSVVPLRAEPGDLEYLLPASPRDRATMERELDELIASVQEKPLRLLLRRCLGRDTALGRAFREHPAATRNHHAYLYGLLEHTLSVASVCSRLAEHYAGQGIALDRDLLIAGALLHDIGKTEELSGVSAPSYTTPGRLLGHIVLGMQRVADEAEGVKGLEGERLLLLQHLIASHQGKPEWDSPRVPQTMEAFVLHYADDLDAKLNQARIALSGVADGGWSEYDRSLGRSLYRPELPGGQGVNGVRSGAARDDSVIDLFRE